MFALSGGDLVGTVSAGATEVIRIHLVSAVAGPAAGDVTYTYSTTLSQPLEHADGALENSITLTGVTVQVTDKDGDPIQGSFNVTIVDDVPQANDDGPVGGGGHGDHVQRDRQRRVRAPMALTWRRALR